LMVPRSAVSPSSFGLIWALFDRNLAMSSDSVVSLCASVSRSTIHTMLGDPNELNLSMLVWKPLNAVRAVWAVT